LAILRIRGKNVRYLTGFRFHLWPVIRFGFTEAILGRGMDNAILYTMSTVSEGDVIVSDSKNWVVRTVYPHVVLGGTTGFYKVVL